MGDAGSKPLNIRIEYGRKNHFRVNYMRERQTTTFQLPQYTSFVVEFLPNIFGILWGCFNSCSVIQVSIPYSSASLI